MIRLLHCHRSAFGLAATLLTLFATDGQLAQASASAEQLNSVISKGDAAYMANKMEEAVTAYAQARQMATTEKADPEMVQLLDERYGRSLAQRAQDFMLGGDDAKAQELIKQALLVLPDDSHVNNVAQRISSQSPKMETNFLVRTADIGRVEPSSAITNEADGVFVSDIQQRQQARLDNAQQEAMDLLMKGRDAYRMNNYEQALNYYQQSLKAMPDVPATAERREFIKASIGDASVALAQEYIKVGRYDESRKLLNESLQIAPCNKLAQKTLQVLDDPTRTNPAQTPQNAKNVTEVNRLLHLGFGHFDLGQFDDALKSFQEVLRIDPYNVSARRGMEMVNKRQSNYYNAAHDQARGEALAEVDQAWERPLPPEELPSDPGVAEPAQDMALRSIDTKLSSIILPRVNLDNVDIAEAVDFLRNQSIQQDNSAAIDAERGVNITLDLGADSEATKAIMAKRFNLKMTNVPLKYALESITQQTGTAYRTNAYTVSVVSASDDSGYMASKVVAVPPGFFSGLGESSDSGDADPFDDSGSGGSGITLKRIDAKKILQSQGVSFPEGSSVRYNPGNSTLFMHNTMKNLTLLDDIVAAKTAQEPLQVVVKATMIEVNQNDLEELGFDWILNTNFNGKIFGGGGQSKSNSDYSNDSIFDNAASVANTTIPNASITSGLRSMNQVITTDSIDSLIENGSKASRGSTYEFGRSPSILTVRGVWNDVDLTFIMHGLNQKKSTDILQQPQVIVKPGETAMFYSGQEILYPSNYESPQIPSSTNSDNSNYSSSTGSMQVTPAHPTDFVSKQAGTLFNVQVNSISDDKAIVDLTITPEMVDFDGFINYGSPIELPTIGYNLDSTSTDDEAYITYLELSKNAIVQPIFTRRSLTTSVSVASGSTVVLGGLKRAKNVSYEDKVPILGDLPLIGRLFRTEGTQVERKVVLIMVRAEIVDPGGKSILPTAGAGGGSDEAL
jgi:general secretion pathway protein D